MKYKKEELKKLEHRYGILGNTLSSKQQKYGMVEVDTSIIKKICRDKNISLKQFLELFEENNSIAKRLNELEIEPYDSISPLKLAILEMENENSIFIDNSLFENREKIEEIRKMWWNAKKHSTTKQDKENA